MKIFAFVFSFFIFSLTIAPAVNLLHTKFSSCKDSCSEKSTSQKDSDGCEKKTCTVFSCCFKTQVFPPLQYKNNDTFQLKVIVKQNFKPKKNYISFQLFDIWHPPKLV